MKKLKALISNRYFPFAVLVCFFLFYCMIVPLDFGDDVYFRKVLQEHTLWEWTVLRYQTWASRNLIEFVMVILCIKPILWRLSMPFVMLVFAFAIYRLFGKTRKDSILICGLTVVLFSSLHLEGMNSAGYIATTLNYFWPAGFGLVAFFPIKKILEGKRFQWYEYLVYPVCMLFGANQEQMCCILLAVYLVFLVYFIKEKRLHVLYFLQLLLVLGSLLFILTCPGNAVRNELEILRWNPHFSVMTLFDKIDVGISCALQYFLRADTLILLFAVSLAVLVFQKFQDPFYRGLAFVPAAAALLFGPFGPAINALYPGFTETFAALDIQYGWLNLFASGVSSLTAFALGCLILVCLMISIYLVFGPGSKAFFMVLLFVLGIGTKMIMGFSPTVVPSGDRTALFLYMTLLVLLTVVYQELDKIKKPRLNKAMYAGAGLCTAVSTIFMFLS